MVVRDPLIWPERQETPRQVLTAVMADMVVTSS